MSSPDFASVAVTFQAIGTLLLALMLWQIGRNFAWRYARAWAFAWLAMFVAIVAVRVFIATMSPLYWPVYLLAQWSFLVLLYAGSREVVSRPLRLRLLPYAIPAAIVLAVVMTRLAPEFNDLFTVEAAIVAGGALASFRVLTAVKRRTMGWQMMRVSLLALATLYFAYVPLYAIHSRGLQMPFLSYSSLADLLGEVVCGFSMMLLASEEARDQLEAKLRTDPLTEALTRHAFHSMPPRATGVAIMIDVDNLKRINDEDGHAAGDLAIRAVANAIRSRIRADDLLFRWGGDEFLVIVPGSTLDLVHERLTPLGDGVRMESGRRVRFSWGAAEFGERSMEEAMRLADEAMYRTRSAARATAC